MSTIKANRWALIVSGVAMSGAGLVLAFLLVFATQNSERYEPHFAWLVWTNVALASILALVILIAIARLALRLRARRFGSKLLFRIIGLVSGFRAPDVVRTLHYHRNFFGEPHSLHTHTALRGEGEWPIGQRELFAAFVSSLNQCRF